MRRLRAQLAGVERPPGQEADFWKTDIFLPKGKPSFTLQKMDRSSPAPAPPDGADRFRKCRDPQMAAGMGGNLLKSLGWRKEQAF
jgi:hypothetical protein